VPTLICGSFFDCFLKGEENGMRYVPHVRLQVRRLRCPSARARDPVIMYRSDPRKTRR
jgi:hypothetical protein